jgi:hypothetical protein
MEGTHATLVRPTQERAMLGSLDPTRSPSQVLLSIEAGLRATDLASLTWAMVPDAHGQIAETMPVANRASTGTTGGRTTYHDATRHRGRHRRHASARGAALQPVTVHAASGT